MNYKSVCFKSPKKINMGEHTIIIPTKLICVVLAIVSGILFGCIKACCNAHKDHDHDDQDPETGLAGVR